MRGGGEGVEVARAVDILTRGDGSWSGQENSTRPQRLCFPSPNTRGSFCCSSTGCKQVRLFPDEDALRIGKADGIDDEGPTRTLTMRVAQIGEDRLRFEAPHELLVGTTDAKMISLRNLTAQI